MANPILTDAGRTYIADQDAADEPVVLNLFKLGSPSVGGGTPSDPLPTQTTQTNVQWTGAPTAEGKLNDDSVVYSLLVGTDQGDFTVTQIGLWSDTGVLVYVANIPTFYKKKSAGAVLGNNFIFNANILYAGIAALAGMLAAAETWQQDFTALLALKENKAEKGAANGYPSLNALTKMPFPQSGEWDIVVGTAAQVTSGDATHTIDNFMAAVTDGKRILLLEGVGAMVRNEDLTATYCQIYSQNWNAQLNGLGLYSLTVSGNHNLLNVRFQNVTFLIMAGNRNHVIAANLPSANLTMTRKDNIVVNLAFADTTSRLGNVAYVNGYVVESQNNKGVANGYAGLDGAGDVPDAQIPAAIHGVGLEGSGVFPFFQVLDADSAYSAYPQGISVQQILGIHSNWPNDGGTAAEVLTMQHGADRTFQVWFNKNTGTAKFKFRTHDTTLGWSAWESGEVQSNKAAANGYASLDALGDVPLAQIPDTLTGKDSDTVDGYQASALEKIASKGAPSGYASLDASTLVPTAQIPGLAASKITSGTLALARIPATLTGKDADTVDGYQAAALEKIASKGVASGYPALNASSVVTQPGSSVRETGSGAGDLKPKVIQIGDWDMDADNFKDIAHGLTFANIRSVEAYVYPDDSSTYGSIRAQTTDGKINGSCSALATVIRLIRLDLGAFDSTNYNATGFNRGFIVVWYV